MPVAGHLARPTRTTGLETGLPHARGAVVPTWSCSRWGLPCRDRYRPRGALLPHPFTLTPTTSPKKAGAPKGGLLSVALSLRSPSPGVTRHRVSMEPGLSSPETALEKRPSGHLIPAECRFFSSQGSRPNVSLMELGQHFVLDVRSDYGTCLAQQSLPSPGLSSIPISFSRSIQAYKILASKLDLIRRHFSTSRL